MSPPGRPKGEYRSAEHAGSPVRPPGRPKGEYRSAQNADSPVRSPACDLLLVDADVATLVGDTPYGAVRDGAVAIRGETIAWVGPRRELPPDLRAVRTVSCGGCWLTPGLIDCHTHLVYAGNRAHEFEQRAQGVTYAEIARAGGGIAFTVRATRAAVAAELAAQSRPRLAALAAEGVTTVEIKSGYGLDTASEMKTLRVARALGEELGVAVRTTLLAAHALPPEFAGRADDYIDYVCADTIPAVAREGLADAVDAYCETIGFTPDQTRRVFAAAHAHGLPVKLHADQLSDMDGGRLAAEASALSADHLEYTNGGGVAAMARAGTVAVLLPGAYYALRETRLPPMTALRAAGVPMAVATDCNPGTSPTTSLLLMLNMACTLFRLTPEEALAGATIHAARALGLHDRGAIAPGMRADLACWAVATPAELAYRIGGNPCAGAVRGGRVAFWSE
jgi:imidazolonepropionase